MPHEGLNFLYSLDMPQEETKSDKTGQVSGWGPREVSHHSPDGNFKNKLLTIRVIVLSRNGAICNAVANNNFLVDISFLCAASQGANTVFPLVSTR